MAEDENQRPRKKVKRLSLGGVKALQQLHENDDVAEKQERRKQTNVEDEDGSSGQARKKALAPVAGTQATQRANGPIPSKESFKDQYAYAMDLYTRNVSTTRGTVY